MPNIEKEAMSSEKPEITLVSPSTTGNGNEKQTSHAGSCAPRCLPYCRIIICRPRGAPPLPPPPWPPPGPHRG